MGSGVTVIYDRVQLKLETADVQDTSAVEDFGLYF